MINCTSLSRLMFLLLRVLHLISFIRIARTSPIQIPWTRVPFPASCHQGHSRSACSLWMLRGSSLLHNLRILKLNIYCPLRMQGSVLI